ncbi:MAG: PAS domain S-box protein [Methyloprofundus sp.]|nr:PAS domain S-box protein [Methyloprofundus sp.]
MAVFSDKNTLKSAVINIPFIRTFLLLMSLFFSLLSHASPTPLDKVSLQLPWKHQFEFAGFYAAIEQGYFAAEGIELEIREYQASIDPINAVLHAEADFGIATDSLIYQRLQGKNIVLLANYFKQYPLVFLAQSGINSLSDLKGKRLMISEKDKKSIIVRTAFFQAGLIPGENIELIPHSFDVAPFVNGEVDAMSAFSSNEPYLLQQKNIAYKVLELTEALPSLGAGNLFSSELQVKQYPKRTQGFIKAAKQGWQYALDHPEEIIELILKKYKPSKTYAALMYESAKVHEFIAPEQYAIGSVFTEHIRSVTQAMLAAGEAKGVERLQGFIFSIADDNLSVNKRFWLNNELHLAPKEHQWLQEKRVIRVQMGDLPPYHYWENGAQGLAVQLLNNIAKKMGLQIEYIQGMPWADALKNIANHQKIDIILAAKRTTEREASMLFSEDYIKLPWVIFTREATRNIFVLEDLLTKQVAVEKGYVLQKRLSREYPNINLTLFAGAPSGLTALSEGKVDAYVGNLMSASYYISQLGLNNLKVAAPIGLGEHHLAFAVRDDWPELAQLLNKGLANISVAERNAINRQYFSVKIDQDTQLRDLWKILLVSLSILLFILLWNYLLRKKVSQKTAQFQQELLARQQGEAKYRRLINSLGNDFIFFTLDAVGKVIYVSPSVTSMLGYTPKECESIEHQYFHLDSVAGLKAVAQTNATLRGEQLAAFESELRHKDGHLVVGEITASPVFDEHGRVIAVEGVMQNIEKRKQAELDLHKHKQYLEGLVEQRSLELHKLSHAIEQSDSSIVITDIAGTIEFVNPAAMRSTGYSRQEMLGQNPRVLRSGQQSSAFYKDMWEVLITGSVWRGELHNKRKNGTLYWEFASISPIKDEQGNTTHYVAVKEEISSRKAAEQALRTSEEMFRGVVENAPVLINAFDKNGQCVLWNKQCERTFAYSFDEIRASSDPLALFYPDKKILEAVRESCSGHLEAGFKRWEPITRHGHQLITYWANAKISDGTVISIGYDDTERQQQQAELQEITQRMTKIASRLPGMIYQMQVSADGKSCLPYASDAIWDLFHVRAEDVREDDSVLYEHIDPADIVLMKASIERCKVALEPWQQEFRIYDERGDMRWLSGTSTPERTADGGFLWHGFLSDITEQKNAQEQIRLAASVFEYSQQSIMITDADNIIIDVNPAQLELTGYTREELLGKKPCLFNSARQSVGFYSDIQVVLREQGYWEGELWNTKKSGDLFAQRQTINIVKDEQGKLQHYVTVASDITHLKEHEANLEQLAYKDALTGLPNRRLLNDRMHQALELAKRHHGQVAVCYLDLDGFKPVNDTYGHKAGDQVLVETAKRLQLAVRAGDTVARLGGDEFVLLLLDIQNIEELEQVINRVLQSLTQAYLLADEEVIVSVSVGIALYPEDNSEAETLLRHADQAMYVAKREGKNCYRFFDADAELRMTAEQLLQQELEYALNKDEFVLYYQPKVNMRSGEVIGVEALLRWQHPEKGLLSPDAFLSAIEHKSIIVAIGHWVLRQAIQQLRAWQAQGIKLAVSVNIATKQLEQKDFVSSLQDLLNEYSDVSSSLLELEILETAAMHDMEYVREVILECAELGVYFALDDFGTGYSSLTYLKGLPVKTIKIDQSFVRGLLHNPDDLVIIQGVLGLSKSFNRLSIAEGVETVQHGILLLNLGCELGQGYGIARPMPAESIPDWLEHYQVADEWLETKRSDTSNREYTLLQMATEHHSLVTRVLYAIEQQLPSLLPKHIADYHACEFGTWLDGDGYKWYGKLAEFNKIVTQHHTLHDLCQQASLLLKQGDNEQVALLVDELKHSRTQLLDSLHRLRYEAQSSSKLLN